MADPNPNAEQIVKDARENHVLIGLDSFIPFLLEVCGNLKDGSGLLRKDGGENIVFYPPANCNISISRICYLDGTLAKILGDAGPSPDSANTPEFDYPNDTVSTDLYIKVIDVPDNGNGGGGDNGGGDNGNRDKVLEVLLAINASLIGIENQIKTLNDNAVANQAALLDHMNRQTYSDTILGNIKLVLHPDPVI